MSLSEEFKTVCIGHLEESYNRIVKCFDHLDESEIWIRKNDSSNAMGNLVVHLAGNIRQYIISSLGEQEDTRIRDDEFLFTRKEDKEALLTILSSTVNEAINIIKQLDDSRLKQNRSVQGFTMTGIAILVHVVEHLSYHTGQIVFFTKYLKGVDMKLYGDLDLNQKNEI